MPLKYTLYFDDEWRANGYMVCALEIQRIMKWSFDLFVTLKEIHSITIDLYKRHKNFYREEAYDIRKTLQRSGYYSKHLNMWDLQLWMSNETKNPGLWRIMENFATGKEEQMKAARERF